MASRSKSEAAIGSLATGAVPSCCTVSAMCCGCRGKKENECFRDLHDSLALWDMHNLF